MFPTLEDRRLGECTVSDPDDCRLGWRGFGEETDSLPCFLIDIDRLSPGSIPRAWSEGIVGDIGETTDALRAGLAVSDWEDRAECNSAWAPLHSILKIGLTIRLRSSKEKRDAWVDIMAAIRSMMAAAASAGEAGLIGAKGVV